MTKTTNWAARDLKHVWHPCSQMKDYEIFQPMPIKNAQGSYITLEDGHRLIDAISSWWCKSLGHGDSRIQNAIAEQMQQFEHIILANTCNRTVTQLAERLAKLTGSLDKVMFASDGSCAVEMALKMSVHAHQLQGQSQRTQFVGLQNAYHGETCATLSVSDLGLYCAPYRALMHPATFLQSIPYVSGSDDPLWHDCSDVWPTIEVQLMEVVDTLSAVIVEPIVQGAGGMLIYSADFLRRLRIWTKEQDVHLIADEIMTGFGRTGFPLACQHAGIEPDFLCLAKGLTAGWLPLSVMLTSDAIYQLFYDDYASGKAFMHSHTHSGNALACAAALAVFDIMQQDNVYAYVQQQQSLLRDMMVEVAEATGHLHNVRGVGAIVAADLKVANSKARVGYAVYQEAVKLGALLRPLGNTVYWLPPLNISVETLRELQGITVQAVRNVLG